MANLSADVIPEEMLSPSKDNSRFEQSSKREDSVSVSHNDCINESSKESVSNSDRSK